MQFHLNGFQPGDPDVSEANARHQAARAADRLPEQVDVLIIGSRPAGRATGRVPRVVEQKSNRLEMFEAFGFADRLMKEAYRVNEFALWKPDETRVHDSHFDVMRPRAHAPRARLRPFWRTLGCPKSLVRPKPGPDIRSAGRDQ